MHDSLTIALLQAREAAMGHFRPIVKRHNLTEQQWRIVRILAENPSMDFHDLAFRACILRLTPSSRSASTASAPTSTPSTPLPPNTAYPLLKMQPKALVLPTKVAKAATFQP